MHQDKVSPQSPAVPQGTRTWLLFVPTSHLCLQFPALTGTWGHFLSRVSKWNPLKLQETLEFDSDLEFLRGFFSSLLGTVVQGLSTNPERVIKVLVLCLCS